uniref:Helicase ATP-binding domain-containing protein n=1 Tax=viral metagenome TaxID=1070528 RepID=A0A6C0HAU2_9ZZZZ
METQKVKWYREHLDDNLENLIHEDNILNFDAQCVRKKSNISKSYDIYKFDNLNFNPKLLLNDIPNVSPKLKTLLDKIEKLDKEDMKKHGKLFKHFIFSDIKSNSAGIKLIASAMLAKKYNLGYIAEPLHGAAKTSDENSKQSNDSTPISSPVAKPAETDDKKKNKKKFKKIELLSDADLLKTTQNNFYLLTSVGLYDQNITVAMKKHILSTFNKRPDNINGELCRFILMDSGFKEGIDLFDIKYVHIFEPSVVSADQKQVIGRGTRTCGQKGLKFHPSRGWPLHVFVYDLSIPEKLQPSMMGAKTAIELYLKAMNMDVRLLNFAHELEKTSVFGSVDYELNKNIHSFSIPNDEDEEELPPGSEFIYGGTKEPKVRLKIREGPPIVLPSKPPTENNIILPNGIILAAQPTKRLGFHDLRKHIREHFADFAWDNVKMENLCANKTTGGAGDVIKYTPTQDFIRHYFTPQNPVKGLLLHHSVGTGKTCSAIAASTSSFEKQGYTILWVTRTTLKSDIWKNMFEQVCNEDIREKIVNHGLVIPEDNKKRIRLVSKAWRIRPMSYKQFSNLVSKQNSFYKTLVKINGDIDPLRKTLLIIDEAHKLYGGGDLSTIERPDMSALHQSLMNSYQVSGADSVKLLLMTATPVTQDPMELIKLINLCKLPDEQMPTEFTEFSNKYLDEQGNFTEKGKDQYLEDIAGHISYLNREKDARQFAQPIIQHIDVPITENIEDIEKFDKKEVRRYMESDITDLKKKIEENNKALQTEVDEIDTNSFNYLYKKCDGIEEPQRNNCEKIVRQNIKDLVNEAKADVDKIKKDIKDLREELKNKNLLKRTNMSAIADNMDNLSNEYDKYKGSLYYNLKSKCGKTIKSTSQLKEKIKEHPTVVLFDKQIDAYNNRITELQNNLKHDMNNYKNRIKQIRLLLKTDLNDLEKNVVRMTIKQEQKTMKHLMKEKTKETTVAIDDIKKSIKKTQKKRDKKYKTIRNTVKQIIRDEKSEVKQEQNNEKKLRKTLRKTGEYTEFNDERIKKLVDTYSNLIDKDLAEMDKREMEAALEKKEAKEEKQREKEQEKLERRATKKAEKEREKEAKKQSKQDAKIADREARKTKKNKK